MPRIDSGVLVASILQLRVAIAATRDHAVRSAVRDVEVRLRDALGPTIPKTKAAAALGISVTALDRWVERGVLPVVATPGSSRMELEARPFLELAAEVARARRVGQTRTPVAQALRRLGWAPRAGGRRVLRLDVAVLPRPNVSEEDLVARFRTTTPAERVLEVAELSRLFAAATEPLESSR